LSVLVPKADAKSTKKVECIVDKDQKFVECRMMKEANNGSAVLVEVPPIKFDGALVFKLHGFSLLQHKSLESPSQSSKMEEE